MKARVIAKINKRLHPSTSVDPLPDPLIPGDILDIVETVDGEYYTAGNNKWYKTNKGFYVWSGGVTKDLIRQAPVPAPVIPAGPQTDLQKLSLNGNVSFVVNNICVAVLDTGISSHNAYRSQINYNKSRSFVEGEATAEDDSGHGSGIAGIIAANDQVIRGVSPGASVINYRVAPGGDVDSNAFYAALKNIVDRELTSVDIINLSLDIHSFLIAPVQTLVDVAASKGVIVVVAAGEDMQRNNTDALKNVIKVSTCTQAGFQKFSNGTAARDSVIFLERDIHSTSMSQGYGAIGRDSAYTAVVSGLTCAIIATHNIKKDNNRLKNVRQILRALCFPLKGQINPSDLKPYYA